MVRVIESGVCVVWVVLCGVVLCVVVVCGGGGIDGMQLWFDYLVVLDVIYGDVGYCIFFMGFSDKVFLSLFNVSDFFIDCVGWIVIVGIRISVDWQVWVFWLLVDGLLDLSCGQLGWFFFIMGGLVVLQCVVQFVDGWYVLGGYLGVLSVWVLCEDCMVDVLFGKNGQVVLFVLLFMEVQDGVNVVVIDQQGRVFVIVGLMMSGKLLLVRFMLQGVVDVIFGVGVGYVFLVLNDGVFLQFVVIVVWLDGWVLIVVFMVYNSQVGYWVGFVQVFVDGSLDWFFGIGGFVFIKLDLNYVVVLKFLMLFVDGLVI